MFLEIHMKKTDIYSKSHLRFSNLLFVSPQMTLTADELFGHKICDTYDIETILCRFGPWEVPHAAK